MSHKMWQRRLGRFVMKNELATRSSPCSFQPPPPPATKTNRNTRIQWEWIITAHKIPRISYTNNNNRQSWVSCGSINETKSKQKKNEKNQNVKPFARKVKLKLGGTCLCTSTIHLKIERTMKTQRRRNEGGSGRRRENGGLVIAQFSLYICCCFSFGRSPDHTT